MLAWELILPVKYAVTGHIVIDCVKVVAIFDELVSSTDVLHKQELHRLWKSA